ncbi:hypothetical protein [uncultured Pseudodesulfovibrio sp.]|uniref:hypothetical protein n=1 Tax=uncultured Pseudodesulfovibrio sp. TaxID=2035858 RepID=UPI0029C6C221|nr:hypothetical protein [uncultured Pseudodesulfovibrio sp.]
MSFTLKKQSPAFEMVSGPCAGHRFEHGQTYSEVPEEHTDRFKKITARKAEPATKKQAVKEGDK